MTVTVLQEKSAAEHAEQVQELQLAEAAEVKEHQDTIWTIIKRNPLILLIIAYANLGSFMFGFDNLALSIALSMPSFGLIYGTPAPDHQSFIIPTVWQSLWNAMPLLTNMLGAFAAGPVADKIGRRWTFGLGSIFSFAGIAVVYIARDPGVFLAGKMINAISLGICLTNGQIYVSEITPLHLRGVALSAYTFSLNLGYLVAASIAFARVAIIEPSGFLTLFASGWAFPGVLLLGMFFIPESPYYLIRKDKVEKAEQSVKKLFGKKADVRAIVNNMHALAEAEKAANKDASDASFLECFRGTNWRRTRIILYCNSINNMVGIPIVSNGPYFMVLAGLPPAKVAMMIELGIGFGMISSVYTFFFLTKFGRRKIIFTSTSVAAVFLLMMGIAGCFPSDRSAQWVVGISLQLLWFCISSCVGPAFATAGEVSSARLRAKSQSIGLAWNYLFSCGWNSAVPYIFNAPPQGGGLLGKTGFIFCATCVVTLVVFWLEFPETKDRSFVELDEMFEQKVPTRKFKEYKTHGFTTGQNRFGSASSA